MPKPAPVPAFSLPGPMIVDQVRLDAIVLGPMGEKIRPTLAVIITPALGLAPHADFSLPAEVDANFRAIADAVRSVVGGEG